MYLIGGVGWGGGEGASDVLQAVEADLKRAATKVIDKAKDLCNKKGVKDMAFEVLDGDARNVACDAVDKHHASLLVMGSHGYGTFKRSPNPYPIISFYYSNYDRSINRTNVLYIWQGCSRECE